MTFLNYRKLTFLPGDRLPARHHLLRPHLHVRIVRVPRLPRLPLLLHLSEQITVSKGYGSATKIDSRWDYCSRVCSISDVFPIVRSRSSEITNRSKPCPSQERITGASGRGHGRTEEKQKEKALLTRLSDKFYYINESESLMIKDQVFKITKSFPFQQGFPIYRTKNPDDIEVPQLELRVRCFRSISI